MAWSEQRPTGSPRDPDDAIRFYALRLREAGMIKASPTSLIAQGTDWGWTHTGKRLVTLTASSRERSRPTFRCRRRLGSKPYSISRPLNRLASTYPRRC
jgi:hypothetical protein